jgi:hypothetical protein
MKNSAALLMPFIMQPMNQYYVDTSALFHSPIFSPRKHTRESYASQQRKAKQRRKSKKYSK